MKAMKMKNTILALHHADKDILKVTINGRPFYGTDKVLLFSKELRFKLTDKDFVCFENDKIEDCIKNEYNKPEKILYTKVNIKGQPLEVLLIKDDNNRIMLFDRERLSYFAQACVYKIKDYDSPLAIFEQGLFVGLVEKTYKDENEIIEDLVTNYITYEEEYNSIFEKIEQNLKSTELPPLKIMKKDAALKKRQKKLFKKMDKIEKFLGTDELRERKNRR